MLRARLGQPQLAVLWLLFLVRGGFYCVALPLWEGFDEPYHFAAVQHVALTRHMPSRETPISGEVQASLYLTPESWMLRLHSLPRPVVTYDDYWALRPEVRSGMHEQLSRLPEEWNAVSTNAVVQNYEGQQAPLFYFVAAGILHATKSLSLQVQVIALRFFNLFLASLVIPLGYLAFKRVFEERRAALLGVAVMISLPELLINLARVSNEALALVIASVIVSLSLYLQHAPRPGVTMLGIGVSLGLGLLTKGYFLTFVPAVLVCFLMLLLLSSRQERRRLLVWGATAAVLTFALAGSWYRRVHHITGSWSGDINDVAVSGLQKHLLVAQVLHVNWKSGMISVLISHIWFGGWSFLKLPFGCYLVTLVLTAGGVIASILALLRPGAACRLRIQILTVLSFCVCFWLGLAYNTLATYTHLGVSATAGWYMYCLVVAEILLIMTGPLYWLPPRYRNPCFVLAIAVLVAIDLYGIHSLMLPYYAGLIRHSGNTVVPLSVPALWNFPVRQVFGNLGSIGPSWLGQKKLIALWLTYLGATLATLWFGILVALPKREPGSGLL